MASRIPRRKRVKLAHALEAVEPRSAVVATPAKYTDATAMAARKPTPLWERNAQLRSVVVPRSRQHNNAMVADFVQAVA